MTPSLRGLVICDADNVTNVFSVENERGKLRLQEQATTSPFFQSHLVFRIGNSTGFPGERFWVQNLSEPYDLEIYVCHNLYSRNYYHYGISIRILSLTYQDTVTKGMVPFMRYHSQ